MTEPGRPRSILIISGYYDEFSEYQEVVLARAFSRYGHVVVFTGDKVSNAFSDTVLSQLKICRQYPEGESKTKGNLVIRRFHYRKVTSAFLSYSLYRSLRREASGFDIVILLGVGQLFSATAVLCPANTIYVSVFGDNVAQWHNHRRWMRRLKLLIFRWTKGMVYRRVVSRCTASFGNTPNTIKRLRDFGVAGDLEALPLAVDESLFSVDERQRAKQREEWGVSSETVFGIVGRVSREKRIELVLQALERVRGNWRLVIVGLGSDPYSDNVRRLVASSGQLSQRTVLLSYRRSEKLCDVLRGIDCGVWPVQPAITIQQAMVCGCRVIVPDNDIVGHLVGNEMQGRRFQPKSADSLVDVLQNEVDRGPSTRSARGERSAMASKFTSSEVARTVLARVGA